MNSSTTCSEVEDHRAGLLTFVGHLRMRFEGRYPEAFAITAWQKFKTRAASQPANSHTSHEKPRPNSYGSKPKTATLFGVPT